ncbi:MAG: hypothetical protein PF961_20350 [Planctomycetota bacterium]|jgi:hypothetical protein|nr:hypothetical protein [Planctomycetota bacterium]
MSEHITHTCVAEDIARLTLAHQGIDAAIRDAVTGREDIAAMGGIAMRGDACVPPILEGLRAKTVAGQEWDDDDKDHLAFAVGWMSHRAADRQMKPVFRHYDAAYYAKEIPGPCDCSVYHDAWLFNHRYGAGDTAPFMKDLPKGALEGAEADVEGMVHMVLRRSLIQLHTLLPLEPAPQPWITGLLKQRQRWRIDMQRYADAMLRPTPEALEQFIDKPNFYDRNDAIIALAEKLQAGESVSTDAIVAACAKPAKKPSLYARILIRSLGYVEAASDCLTGAITIDEFRQRQDVGRPEIDMAVI